MLPFPSPIVQFVCASLVLCVFSFPLLTLRFQFAAYFAACLLWHCQTLITRGLGVSFECRLYRMPSTRAAKAAILPCGLHKFSLKYFLKTFATHTHTYR